MLQFVLLLFGIYSVHGYFTLPGNCPESVTLKENFRLASVIIGPITLLLYLSVRHEVFKVLNSKNLFLSSYSIILDKYCSEFIIIDLIIKYLYLKDLNFSR